MNKLYVYATEVEWNTNKGPVRDQFHGYAENPGQAEKKIMTAIQSDSGLKGLDGTMVDAPTSRVVHINELGPVAFQA
jgi:hypothetical protein